MTNNSTKKPVPKQKGSIDNINIGLSKYYKELGLGHIYSDFREWYEENGFDDDDDDFIDELRTLNADSSCLEFDDNFPLLIVPNNSDLRIIEILKIIRFCYFNGRPPKQSIRHRTAININISPKNVTKAHEDLLFKRYTVQIPYLFPTLREPDLIRFLSVSYANNDYPYLSNLVDSFCRYKLYSKLNNQPLTITNFIRKPVTGSYISKLHKSGSTFINSLENSMKNYVNRICPQFKYNISRRVNDNILDITNYIILTTGLIKSIITNENAVPPFQCDLIFSVDVSDDKTQDAAKPTPNTTATTTATIAADDDDDDDSDGNSDDEKVQDIDFICNIQSKIQYLNLAHTMDNYDKMDDYDVNDVDTNNEYLTKRRQTLLEQYRKLRDALVENSKNNNTQQPISGLGADPHHKPFDAATYPNKKRFIIHIDRRTPQLPNDDDDNKDNNDNDNDNNKDAIIFYEAPYICDTIPAGKHINLWYFASARLCLIPHDDFYNEILEKRKNPMFAHKNLDNQVTTNNDDDNKTKAPPKPITITSETAAQNKILTFSFHCEQSSQIKCYMYWSGTVHRFYPFDIIDIFKFVFTAQKWQKFLQNDINLIRNLIDRLIFIKDLQFEHFFQSLDKNSKIIFPKNSNQYPVPINDDDMKNDPQ